MRCMGRLSSKMGLELASSYHNKGGSITVLAFYMGVTLTASASCMQCRYTFTLYPIVSHIQKTIGVLSIKGNVSTLVFLRYTPSLMHQKTKLLK